MSDNNLPITLGVIYKEMQLTPSTRLSLFVAQIFKNRIVNYFVPINKQLVIFQNYFGTLSLLFLEKSSKICGLRDLA